MAYQVVENTAQVDIVYQQSGELGINTFYFFRDTAWGNLELGALCDAVYDVWAELVDTLYGNSFILLRAEGRGLRASEDAYAVSSGATVTGGASGTGLPNNVVYAVRRLSGVTGKNSRGRVFMPVNVAGNMLNNNYVTNTFKGLVVDLLSTMNTAAFAEGWTPVIVSRFLNNVKRAEGEPYTMTEWSARDNRVDTLRSRLPE